jgi:hypothetical protein
MLRRTVFFCLFFVPLSVPLTAFASADWQPTPDELSMKSYAPDPNAPAVYLYREGDGGR